MLLISVHEQIFRLTLIQTVFLKHHFLISTLKVISKQLWFRCFNKNVTKEISGTSGCLLLNIYWFIIRNIWVSNPTLSRKKLSDARCTIYCFVPDRKKITDFFEKKLCVWEFIKLPFCNNEMILIDIYMAKKKSRMIY